MKTYPQISVIVFLGTVLFFPLICQKNPVQKLPQAPSPAPAPAPAPTTAAAPTVPVQETKPPIVTTPPTGTAQGPAIEKAPPAPALTIIQTKLLEINNRPIYLDKMLVIKEVLGLVTSTTAQADKNLVVATFNTLFTNQGLMKKMELTSLKTLFESALASQFLLTSDQRATMEQSIKSINNVLSFATNSDTLVIALKKTIENTAKDYSLALQAALCAITLFDTKLPAELLTVLRAKIPVLYNTRGNKKLDDLKTLETLLSTIKSKDLADVIGATWLNTTKLDVALAVAQAQTNILSKLTDLQNISKMLTAKTDRYEKDQFTDMLTNIFTHRSERAPTEIEALKSTIATLTSGDFIKNKVFDKSDATRFESWNKILDTTIALLALNAAPSVDQKLTGLIKILPDISIKAADYERTLFVLMFLDVLMKRKEVTNTSNEEIKKFLVAVEKTDGLLSKSQLLLLKQWLDALR